MKRTVTLMFGRFTVEALADEDVAHENLAARAVRAIRYYLSDSDRPDWPYPGFLQDGEVGERVELELSVDDAVWGSLQQEADRQGVSVQQLAEHAALYFAADRDAGRITQRILANLESES